MKKKEYFTADLLLILYVVLFALVCVAEDGESAGLWILLEICSQAASVYLLWRYHFPEKKYIAVAGTFAVVYMLSGIAAWNGMITVLGAANVFLAAAASSAVFAQYETGTLLWIRGKTRKDWVFRIGIGVGVGGLLGVINCLLMYQSNPLAPAGFGPAFFCALNPAVFEEIACRTIFYALLFCLAKGKMESRGWRLRGWIFSIVPHVLPHTGTAFLSSPVEWIVTVFLYAVVFGLPFALLQKKRDIVTAMFAHGVVDAIRFCLFGLPV